MFDEPAKEIEAFNVVKRGKSFKHAFRGIYIILRTQPNMLIHVLAGLLAVSMGFYFKVSEAEWFALILSIGFVVVTEAFNTAIEFDIDLTSPQDHPFARDTKDAAAGAVLIATITSVIVGIIIFLPKILNIFS